MQYLESEACWSDGRATRWIVEAVDDAVAERPDLRVVAVQDEHGLGRELVDGHAPALGDQLELAVAVELVAEEVPEAHGTRADAPEHLREGRLRPPRGGRARRPGPRGGWRPRRRRGSRRNGCARDGSAGRRISAAIAEVVVLPFVAEMTAVPAGKRAARRSIAPGSSFERSLPGTVIPAPAPTRRESAATPRAARISTARRTPNEGTRRAG